MRGRRRIRRVAVWPTVTTDRDATAIVRELRSVDEVIASYRMRREEYEALGYLRASDDADLEIDGFDRDAIAFGAFDPTDGEMIGTLRLIGTGAPDVVRRALANPRCAAIVAWTVDKSVESRQRALPSIVSSDVADRLAAFNHRGAPVLELSRMIVRPHRRSTGVSRRLMELGIARAASRGPAILVGGCLDEHVRMYARYGYRVLPGSSAERFDDVGRIARVVVCRTDELPEPTRTHVGELLSATVVDDDRRIGTTGEGGNQDNRRDKTRKSSMKTTTSNGKHLTEIFEAEGRGLDAVVRGHPSLRPLFRPLDSPHSSEEAREAYLNLLRVKVEYVRYTVPALRAAGQALSMRVALAGGDDEDLRWSGIIEAYAADESDGARGHHEWARDDMRALGATGDLLDRDPCAHALLYQEYFVEDALEHPYAILGAKGVLERFSIALSDDVTSAIRRSGIERAGDATTFFRRHGSLDLGHVREGDRNLASIEDPRRRAQIVAGAYFASGTYRSLARQLLPSTRTP